MPDATDVEGVLADEERRQLLRMREERGPAGTLAVAEADALEAVGGQDARDDHVDLAERTLASGRHLRVGHRLLQGDAIEGALDPLHGR